VLDPQKVKYRLFEPSKQDAPPRLDQMAVGNVGWHELLTDDQATAFDYYSRHYGWQKDLTRPVGEDFLRRRDCFGTSCGWSVSTLREACNTSVLVGNNEGEPMYNSQLRDKISSEDFHDGE
jgi:hypothetical protein